MKKNHPDNQFEVIAAKRFVRITPETMDALDANAEQEPYQVEPFYYRTTERLCAEWMIIGVIIGGVVIGGLVWLLMGGTL